MLSITLPSTLSSIPPSRSQVHSQEGRQSESHLTICSHVRSYMHDPETSSVREAWHRKVWGRWLMVGTAWRAACGMWSVADGGQHMVAELMTLVDIMVWTLYLVCPPWQDLTMPNGHGVDNCSVRFHRNGSQFKLGESRSPTQIFQQNLLPTSTDLEPSTSQSFHRPRAIY